MQILYIKRNKRTKLKKETMHLKSLIYIVLVQSQFKGKIYKLTIVTSLGVQYGEKNNNFVNNYADDSDSYFTSIRQSCT